MPLAVVILAAGQGTRMRSSLPKVLHDVCGRPMVLWPVAAAQEAGAERVVVVGGPDRALAPHLPDGVRLAVQEQARGTGDAVRSALRELGDAGTVIVLAGDVPLVTAAVVRGLAEGHEAAGAAATMLTMELDDPSGYGRVVRGPAGDVERVVETKAPGDATREELAIREVNTGIFAFDVPALRAGLEGLTTDNAQGEEYLPDVLPVLAARGDRVAAHRVDDPHLTLGVNDRVDLAAVRAIAQRRIVEALQRGGVDVLDPARVTIDVGVTLGEDTVVEPGTVLRGRTRAGRGCRLGPNTTLVDTSLGDGAVAIHAYGQEATLEDGASAGPFAYLRPGTVLRAGARVGTFVEVKNSDIGPGTKVPHLSYVGDADVGGGSNLGAGTITANYDGVRKHRTTIGEGVRGGVDTAFVAPVTVGDGAWTAAGSVVTEDVPPGALAVARARQRNVDGYATRKSGDRGTA